MTAADRGGGARAMTKGEAPFQPANLAVPPIPTYCGDTVLRVPPGAGDDEALVLEHSRRVLAIIRVADTLKGEVRDDTVIGRLKE
jgi:hypothetical protein